LQESPLLPEYVEMLSELSAAGVRFLVVGAYAVALHHKPRATKDIDIFIRADPENARRVLQAIDRFGAPRTGLTLKDLSTPGLVFQIGIAPRRIDLITQLSGIEFEEAWASHIEAVLPGTSLRVPVIGREALLKNKRATGRPQDQVDAANIERTPSRKPRRKRKR
jgi:hypothetical protein